MLLELVGSNVEVTIKKEVIVTSIKYYGIILLKYDHFATFYNSLFNIRLLNY